MLQKPVICNGDGLDEGGLTHEALRKIHADELVCDSHRVEILRVEHKGLGRASEMLRLFQDERTDDQVVGIRAA